TMSGVASLGGSSVGTFLSRFPADSAHGTSVPVYRNSVDSTAGRRVLYDKPWMIVDHREGSPHRGAVYLSVGAITVGLGPAGPGIDWTPLASQELLAVSRDGGRSFSPPTVVS